MAVEVLVDVWVWVWVFVLVSVLVDSLDVVPVLSDVAVFAASVPVARAVWAFDAAPATALLACWATVPVPPDPQAARAITHTTTPPERSSRLMMGRCPPNASPVSAFSPVLRSSETGDLDHLIRVMPERGECANVSRRDAMFRQLGVVISVGLADSLNPSTVGPALFLAAGRDRVRRVGEFTLGVWVVNLAGGLLLMIGPGRLLLDLVPHPRGTVRHIIELVAGVILVVLAVTTWAARRKLARRPLPGAKGSGGSSFVTGASLAAVELPTAAPYLAVIAGLVASTLTIPEEILLLLLYNLAFIGPMLVILGVLIVAGDRADPWLRRVGDWIQRRWPVVLAFLLMFVGGVLAILGGLGLLGGP